MILVLKDGEIVERGSHAELMGNTQGLYYSMWMKQLDDEVARLRKARRIEHVGNDASSTGTGDDSDGGSGDARSDMGDGIEKTVETMDKVKEDKVVEGRAKIREKIKEVVVERREGDDGSSDAP